MARLMGTCCKLSILVAALLQSCTQPVGAHSRYLPKQSGHNQSLDRVYDYVVVGGGPGGLVMANRLSEDPSVTVAVVEAGTWAEKVVGNLTEVPAYDVFFAYKAANATVSGVDWGFLTTPQTVSVHKLSTSQFRAMSDGLLNRAYGARLSCVIRAERR